MTGVVPRVKELSRVNPTVTSYMRLFDAPESVAARVWTPLSEIAPLLPSALIRVEDPHFFDHHGVDWRATRRVVRGALRTGRINGGASTLAQQLARNLYLTPRRSVVRKLREMVVALRLYRTLSKARILELYLNVVEWGPGVWGVAGASDYYFAKAPRDLDLFEATFLVTLLAAPKSGLAGRLAMRSRRLQLMTGHQLLFSGQASAEACARCSARVRELHRLIADGVSLRAALRQSASVDADADARFLAEIVDELHLELIGPDEMLTPRCAEHHQLEAAYKQLRTRFGRDLMRDLFATGSYRALMNHPAAPRPRAIANGNQGTLPVRG
jgi:monofunctional biosynthetic peptidoglycan transglycosylase